MKISDIKDLATVSSKHGLCVSLFLNIDKTHQDRHDLKTTLNHLINEEERNLSAGHDAKKHLRADYEKIWDFIDTKLEAQNKRGLAIFSNSESGFFKFFYFIRPIENRIVFSTKYLIRPLIRYTDDNAKILAVFVDQSRGRLIEIEEGEIIKFLQFEDEVPKKVKSGTHYGLADKRIERHVDWHIQNHLKKIARMTLDILKEDNYDWLFIYGQNNELADFNNLLHSYPKRKLAFERKVDLLDERNRERYLNDIQTSLVEVEKEKHQQLNDELFEDYPHRAVLGLDEVQYELDRKSVFKLILSNRFASVYPVCGKCNYFVHEQLICPNCGADLSLIDRESNEMVEKALFQDSEIHFIDSASLDEKGAVGAILRWESEGARKLGS